MVSLQLVQKSNARIANLPKGLVVLFIGATSGIGQSALENFSKYAVSPRIYTVARPASVASHETFLATLRQSSPMATYDLITADVSLVSEVDRVVKAFKEKEGKLDLLFLSTGFMPIEGRFDTSEGLEPSMTTRYYSRARAVQQLLPLLNQASNPRIVSVLAGSKEEPLNEEDLDVRDPANWSFWKASTHSTTMGTLVWERFARQNPNLGIVHWYPGPVSTPGLTKLHSLGFQMKAEMSQDEAGARAVFFATNDRYTPQGGGYIPIPDGLTAATKSGGGVFLLDQYGESVDNEGVLGEMRRRGIDEKVWKFTEDIFAKTCGDATAGSNVKDEL